MRIKLKPVNLVLSQNYSRPEVGRRLGAHQAATARWVREYKQRPEDNGNEQLPARQLQKEIKKLKKEIQRLTMEREVSIRTLWI